MPSFGNTLGLHRSPLVAPAVALGFNFFWANVIMSGRAPRVFYGIDSNANPRANTTEVLEKAKTEGKISESQVRMFQRWEGAGLNSLENFTLFAPCLLFGLHAGLPAATIQRACAVYTAARVAFGVSYIAIEDEKLSYLRSAIWWVGTLTCLNLLRRGSAQLAPTWR
ncbi:hypothetical protein MBLNU457_2012t1 [Dothideomycetes sp. NU457]